MIEDYEIVEYINPYFPDRQMYSCRVSNSTYHTDDVGELIDWIIESIEEIPYLAERQAITDKAIESFFKDSNTSKD